LKKDKIGIVVSSFSDLTLDVASSVSPKQESTSISSGIKFHTFYFTFL